MTDSPELLPELPLAWHAGEPPHPWRKEWFIAETIHGDRVVLKALPEEYVYDYRTADDTYMKATNIKRWMQFPDSEYIAPTAEPPPRITAEMAKIMLKALYEGSSIAFNGISEAPRIFEVLRSIAAQSPEQGGAADRLEQAWRKIAKTATEDGDYLFFKAGWEAALDIGGPSPPLPKMAFERFKRKHPQAEAQPVASISAALSAHPVGILDKDFAASYVIIRGDEYEILRQIQFYARGSQSNLEARYCQETLQRFLSELRRLEDDPEVVCRIFNPAADPPQPVALSDDSPWPAPSLKYANSGWKIDFKFLKEIQKDCGDSGEGNFELEYIEAILLAGRARLTKERTQ